MAKSQDNNQNYVVSKSYLDDSASRQTTSVQYFDGLGRKTQMATNEIGTGQQYVYTYTQYDQCGRDSVVWLPRTGNTTPEYMSDFVSDANAPYSADDFPFSITTYDGISRPIKTSTAGQEWHSNGKAKYYHYDTNRNESEEIKMYTTDSKDNEVVSDNGYYPEYTLFKEESIDEDGHSIIQYKNLKGNLVMEKHNGADTYYVYDIYNNLRFVLPPNCPSISTSDLHKYAYIYKYDNMNRCIEKKLPGCESSIFVYDYRDRLVVTQDPCLCEKGLYRFMLYDELGRVAIQGTTTNYSASDINAFLAFKVISSGTGHYDSGYNIPSMLFPNGINLEIVNYYDDYSFLDHIMPSGNNLINNLRNDNYIPANDSNRMFSKGALTGQIVVTSSGNYLFNTFYYNSKGLVVDERHSTLNGKVYKVFTNYSFTDKPTQVTKVIPASGDNAAIAGRPTNTINDYTLITSYSYNSHNDQLESVSIQCGDNTPVVVSQISYDDLGRIQSNAHPEINDVITYDYDLHGWTTGINGSYFKETLHYADGPNDGNYCYNGDISAQEWMASDTIQRGYKFLYNNRDMLYQSYYGEGENLNINKNRYNEYVLEFNSNNAIARLQRKGKNNAGNYSIIDFLIYDYDGDKVTGIRDRYTTQLSYVGAFEYKNTHNATNAEPDFEYNSAGMLIKDRDKGINRIKYNDIGLVDSIVFDNGAKVEYTYGLNGEKLKVVHRVPQSNLTGTDLGNGLVIQRPIQIEYNTREYLGGDVELEGESWIYGKTYKYYFGDGYVQFYPGSSQAPRYYFYSKDHLGNVRSVVTKNPTTNEIAEVQQTHYYPFGGIIADLSTGRSVQNKLYNGKELDTNNNLWWYDYGARQYDPTRGQFTKYDQHCENYYNTNPLTYCGNNPISRVDPTGMDWYQNEDGTAAFWQEGSDQSVSVNDVTYNNIGSSYTISSDKNGWGAITFTQQEWTKIIFNDGSIVYNSKSHNDITSNFTGNSSSSSVDNIERAVSSVSDISGNTSSILAASGEIANSYGNSKVATTLGNVSNYVSAVSCLGNGYILTTSKSPEKKLNAGIGIISSAIGIGYPMAGLASSCAYSMYEGTNYLYRYLCKIQNSINEYIDSKSFIINSYNGIPF